MKKREYRDYLNDIVECINDVKSFIDGMTYKEFSLDKKTINAVVRSIEIVGEAGTLRLRGPGRRSSQSGNPGQSRGLMPRARSGPESS